MNLNHENREFQNKGGLSKILFIPVLDINSIPDIIHGFISGIDILPGGNLYQFEFVQETGIINEVKKSVSNFTYSVSGKISKDRIEIRNNLESIDKREFIVFVTDNNSVTRVIGSLDNPVRFSDEMTSGERVSDLNNFTVSIEWNSKYRAAFFDLTESPEVAESGCPVYENIFSGYTDLQAQTAVLPLIWLEDVASIRAIEIYVEGQDVGNYETNAVYQFDSTSNLADDGYNVLKPTDITSVGRFILKARFAAHNLLSDTDGDTFLGVEKTTDADYAFVKVPHVSSIPAFKIINGNGDTVFEFDSKGQFWCENPAYLPTFSLLFANNETILKSTRNIDIYTSSTKSIDLSSTSLNLVKGYLQIKASEKIRFNVGISYQNLDIQPIKTSYTNSLYDRDIKINSYDDYNGQNYPYYIFSRFGGFMLNTESLNLVHFKNNKTPSWDDYAVNCVNGSTTVEAGGSTPRYSMGVLFHPGAKIKIDGVSYTIASITSDSYLELTTPYAGVTDTFLKIEYDNTDDDIFVIKRTGEVGINTALPREKLDLVGNFMLEGIQKNIGFTQTEIDAMTPEAGWELYNSTTNKKQCFNGTVWTDLF